MFGWLFGLSIGTDYLVLPEIGLVVVAGPLAARDLGGHRRGAGPEPRWAAWPVRLSAGMFRRTGPSTYEKWVKRGEFLLLVRSSPEIVATALATCSLRARAGPRRCLPCRRRLDWRGERSGHTQYLRSPDIPAFQVDQGPVRVRQFVFLDLGLERDLGRQPEELAYVGTRDVGDALDLLL